MVVLANPELQDISLIHSHSPPIPEIDLTSPAAPAAIVAACRDLGFFKLTNHGVPPDVTSRLEAEAMRFFSLPRAEKQRQKQQKQSPFGYGNKNIGSNGDVGWVEYLLLEASGNPNLLTDPSFTDLRSLMDEYLWGVKKLTKKVLELMAEGLGLRRDAFSRLVMDEKSDCMFRMNHYPPYPALKGFQRSVTGFGEHTDPQVITVLRSNNSTGLQVSLRDGSWVSVPPDQGSFFINVGDSMQVLTNGRFKSVRHRVMANGFTSRVSMIFFGGADPEERIAPMVELMEEGEEAMYKGFTWGEYKRAAYKSRLADNRLAQFEKERGEGGGGGGGDGDH